MALHDVGDLAEPAARAAAWRQALGAVGDPALHLLAASRPPCRAPRRPPSPTPRWPRGWRGRRPGAWRVTAFRMRLHERVAELERIALDGGQASMSWVTSMTMPRALRLVAPARRRHLEGLGDHRGQAHRAEGHLGLAGDELLEAPHRDRRFQRHVADHLEPPLRGVGRLLLQQQLGIGEDGGERVVEVVGEPAHRLAERRGGRSTRLRSCAGAPRGAGSGRAPSRAGASTERSSSIFVRASWRAMSRISS